MHNGLLRLNPKPYPGLRTDRMMAIELALENPTPEDKRS